MEENDDFNNDYNDNEIDELVNQFKEAVDAKSPRFFDSDDLELIADELIARFEFFYANEAVELGIRLYPKSFAFRILKVKKLIMELKLETASKELDKIEDEFPPSAEFYLEKAFFFKISGKDDAALPLLQKAYEMEPENPEINFMLGGEYVKNLQFKKGLQLVIYALEEDDVMEEQLFTISYIFEDISRPDAAVDFFRALTDQFPLSKASWFALGLSLGWQKEFEECIEAYMNVISLDEESSTAYFNIGNAYYDLQKYEEAIHYYQETLRWDENDFHAMSGIGDCYLELEQYDAALNYYHQALDIEPNTVDAIMGCITVLRDTGRESEAEAFIKKSFTLNPQSFELLFGILPYFQEEEQIEKLKELVRLTIEQVDNKEDFFRYFTSYCCATADLRKMGIDILEEYLDNEDLAYAIPYFLSALHYLSGNSIKGHEYLQNALLINYNGYRVFLALSPELGKIEEVQRQIEIYRPN